MSIGFSADSSFVAAQGGAPEWNLTVWQWEKSKLAGIAKGVTQVGFVQTLDAVGLEAASD